MIQKNLQCGPGVSTSIVSAHSTAIHSTETFFPTHIHSGEACWSNFPSTQTNCSHSDQIICKLHCATSESPLGSMQAQVFCSRAHTQSKLDWGWYCWEFISSKVKPVSSGTSITKSTRPTSKDPLSFSVNSLGDVAMPLALLSTWSGHFLCVNRGEA